MDLKQYLLEAAPLLTLGAYTFAVSYFFYRLNKETINEWRTEHKQQMQEWRSEHTKQIEKIDSKIDKMDAKWERLFERLLIQDQQKKPS